MAADPYLGDPQGCCAVDIVVGGCIQICEFGYCLTCCVWRWGFGRTKGPIDIGLPAYDLGPGRGCGIPGLKGETWGTAILESPPLDARQLGHSAEMSRKQPE
jgi:hypothetical protein